MKQLFLFLCLAFPWHVYPCTTLSFLDENNDRIFGKTFDWYFDHGIAFVNKRNVYKEALILDTAQLPLTWTSRFGSVSFNQHGRDFPLGGMNEAGLVVEIMIGPTQDIPAAANIRNVNEVQIIQYMLDSFANIPEVVDGLQNLRVARVSSDVHYLVCDKKSQCATVEFLNGKLTIHRGSNLPYSVFANSSYEESSRHASKYEGLGGNLPIPTDGGSLSRFVRAAHQARSYKGGDAISYLHSFLDEVALSGKWRIGYKGTKEIFFRAVPDLGTMKEISMEQDFSCTTDVLVFPMNKSSFGNIQSDLETYTQEHNEWLVNSNFLLPVALRQQMINYPQTHTKCLSSGDGVAALD